MSVLIEANRTGNAVALVSNHAEPSWFQSAFGGSGVQFLQERGRQSGEIVSQNAERLNLKPFDVIVLASKDVDVQMGKNGRALLVAAGTSASRQVQSLGVRVNDASEFAQVIQLTAGWSGHWWFSGDAPNYYVRALSDLSGYGKPITQQEFARRLTNTVKNGGARLNALLAVTARSLLIDGADTISNLVWGVYPSSQSTNDDRDTLSDFTHRLRTTVSRVRYAERGEPLFIRHAPSVKRSAGGGGDRTDPSGQIQTIHLNPRYNTGNQLRGKHVIVVDDCTTYGVSFGVAAAFLRKAGAASVTGIALGKFGNQLRQYDIEILTDPFAPVVAGGYVVHSQLSFNGKTNQVTQQVLQELIS
ncbi:phosphoribosyltransferase [Parapusillimonas sp. JC17]|uniref:phosphoribosyltransferase n=1 Tax=Parapusillimonas sp. JC17 TaxID=3445768 RepID=UPI003F9F9C01